MLPCNIMTPEGTGWGNTALPPVISRRLYFGIQALRTLRPLLGRWTRRAEGSQFPTPSFAHFLFPCPALRPAFRPQLFLQPTQAHFHFFKERHASRPPGILRWFIAWSGKLHRETEQADLSETIIPEGQPIERQTKRPSGKSTEMEVVYFM